MRQAVFGVRSGHVTHLRLDVVRGVAHRHAVAGVAQHIEVVVVVAKGDDFVGANAQAALHELDGLRLGGGAVDDFEVFVFGAVDFQLRVRRFQPVFQREDVGSIAHDEDFMHGGERRGGFGAGAQAGNLALLRRPVVVRVGAVPVCALVVVERETRQWLQFGFKLAEIGVIERHAVEFAQLAVEDEGAVVGNQRLCAADGVGERGDGERWSRRDEDEGDAKGDDVAGGGEGARAHAVFAVEQGAVNVAEDGAVGHGVLLWILEQF